MPLSIGIVPCVVVLCPESVIAGVPWKYQVVLGGGVPLSVSEGVPRVVKLRVGIVYWGVVLCPESVIAGVPWGYQVVLDGGVPLSVNDGVPCVVELCPVS